MVRDMTPSGHPSAATTSARSTRRLLGFPNPVNETAARVVAAGVAALALVTLATEWLWLLPVLAIGFAARTLSGPRFSALGRLATLVIAPRLGPPRFVPGPPKRFAQGLGLVVTTIATVAAYGFGAERLALGLAAILLAFASLEALLGVCAGCWLFGVLTRVGLIPDEVCAQCADISRRYRDSAFSGP